MALRDIEGLSTREVAQVADTSEANVKHRLHRARLLRRKALAEPEGSFRRRIPAGMLTVRVR